ncbi:Hypothetical protein, putative [Bodo saltans]|uniref:Uncharacterized protein n=1 Tax=Bodo saltans TaxID=75058 RepID=A0A0S4JXE2_BODSA|nr:Hypothetical protein, putative [Bodo saltans]|eukprot:CUG93817.1 Hypothetical protein, putative [Bodo saltans]
MRRATRPAPEAGYALGATFCDSTTQCRYCSTASSIGVCLLQSTTCYPTSATTEVTACTKSSFCKWCDAIGICDVNAASCRPNCIQATNNGVGYCQTATTCQWCPLGFCQNTTGTCWDTCLSASNDVAANDVCSASSTLCQWCAGLQYCTNKNIGCRASCAAIDDSAICQVTSIRVNSCTWCTPVRSCYNKSLSCPGSCSVYLGQRSSCEAFSGCHWCAQHGSGRCKPVKGNSLGYVDWRGEVECDTNTRSFSMSNMISNTVSTSHDVSDSFSASFDVSGTPSAAKTATPTLSGTFTDIFSASMSVSAASLSRDTTVSISRSHTTIVSDSSTPTFSEIMMMSTTKSLTHSASHSRSESRTVSTTESSSPSSSHTDSPTISIDPCNTTFRDNPTSFVRHIALLNTEQYGTVNSTDSTFLVLNRVELAALRTLRIQIGFNTYLRNFYYNTSMSWFPLPQVSNCISSGFELVNATDFIVLIDYNPDVSFSVGLDDDYFCNMTFSTDIFQCQLMTNFTFNFSAAILVTGTPRVISASAAQAIGIASSILAIIAISFPQKLSL